MLLVLPLLLFNMAPQDVVHARLPTIAAGLEVIENFRAIAYGHRHLGRQLLRASMIRTANCWDHAVMERFFLNVKMERV